MPIPMNPTVFRKSNRIPHRIEMNIKAASLIWDTLLQSLSKGKRSFYSALANALLAEIVTPTATDPNFGARKSAMCKWLVHLVTGKQWKQVMSISQVEMQTQIAETCLLDPSAWGHKLVKSIVDRADDEFRELWGPLYEAAVFDRPQDMDDVCSDGPSTDGEPVSDEEAHIELDVDVDDGNTKAPSRLNDVRSTIPTRISMMKKSPSRQTLHSGSSDRGWQLWEGGWVARPIGV